MEIFKDISGYENIYQVSNFGNIKSLIKRRSSITHLKQSTDKGGYKIVTLCKDRKHLTKTVHRLVAIAFLGDSNLQVNHKDGDKSNNKLFNLEFISAKENMRHAIKNKLLKPNTTKIAEEKRKQVIQISVITNEVVNKFISAHDAARKTGFNRGNISTACRENKVVENYKWQYVS